MRSAMAWRNAVLAAPCLLLAMAHAPARAADTGFITTAAQDTSIFSGTADSDTLADGSGDYLWLAVTAEGLNRRMLLKFDLAAVPAGSVVRQVSLTLYESRARDEHTVRLHRLLASWGEGVSNAGGAGTGARAAAGDATWRHRFFPGTPWATPGGDFAATASAALAVGLPNTTYTWTGTRPAGGGPVPGIVQDVQAWVDAPAVNHGWIAIGNEAGLQNAKRFESRDNAVAVNRPRLTVVYGPPEAAAADGDVPLPLWALGLLAGALASAVALPRPLRSRGAGAAGPPSKCHERQR